MKTVISAFISMIWLQVAGAQSLPQIQEIDQLMVEHLAYHQPLKTFLHTDKDIYLSGEELLGKVFQVNAVFNTPDKSNDIVYVSLRKDGVEINKVIASLSKSEGKVSMRLAENLSSGWYQLVTYARWQLNDATGKEHERSIYILNPSEAIIEEDGNESKQLILSVIPEGGELIANEENEVVVTVSSLEGSRMSGTVLVKNTNNEEVAALKLSEGIGSLTFIPQTDEYLFSFKSDAGSSSASKKMTSVDSKGLIVKVQNNLSDRIIVQLKKTAQSSINVAMALIHVNGVIVSSFPVKFSGDKPILASINRETLLPGVNELLIISVDKEVLAQKLFLNRSKGPTSVKAELNQATYGRREPITLNLQNLMDSGDTVHLSVSVNHSRWFAPTIDRSIKRHLLLNANLKNSIGQRTLSNKETDALLLQNSLADFSWQTAVTGNFKERAYDKERMGFSLTAKLEKPMPEESLMYLTSPSKNVNTFYRKFKGDSVLFYGLPFYESQGLRMSLASDLQNKITIVDPLMYAPPLSTNTARLSAQQKLMLKKFGNESKLIEDSFGMASSKKDTQRSQQGISKEFHLKPDFSVETKRYRQLQDLEEIIYEIVPSVRASRSETGAEVKVYVKSKGRFQDNPGIFLDMIPIYNVEEILSLKGNLIEKIDVITEVIKIGELKFNGVLAIYTKKGDLGGVDLPNTFKVGDIGIQTPFNFSAVTQAEAQQKRRPYYPLTTYWNPSVTLNTDMTKEITFFAPDDVGEYYIEIAGVSNSGKLVYKKLKFEVK